MSIVDLMIIVFGIIFLVLLIFLRSTKVPKQIYKNRTIYSDYKERPVKPLFSEKYRLTGKPDFILHTKDGLLPLEIKKTQRPNQPYFSHIMQLISYCILLEERGDKPKYGFIQYNGGEAFPVSYTEGLKSHLLKVMEEMRACVKEPRGICRKCSGGG